MTTRSIGRAGSRWIARLVPTLGAGVVGGLAGGIAFGIMMQAMDMIPMVAMLVGSESVAVGWLVHLAVSVFIGATFAVLVGRRAATLSAAVPLGIGYGVVWWVLGALLLMPATLGMTDMIFELNTTAWRSLAGHLVYGLLLGLGFGLLAPRLSRRG